MINRVNKIVNKVVDKKEIKGFTLVEILATTTIFLILTTIIVVDFKYKIPKDALGQGVEQFVTLYRQAQTATMSGANVGATSPNYGLYLSKDGGQSNKIIVFADLNKDKHYITNEESRTNCSNCGIFSLPNGVNISGLIPETFNTLTIIFSATSTKEIYFNGSPATANGQITLKQSETEETSNITIYYLSGQISR